MAQLAPSRTPDVRYGGEGGAQEGNVARYRVQWSGRAPESVEAEHWLSAAGRLLATTSEALSGGFRASVRGERARLVWDSGQVLELSWAAADTGPPAPSVIDLGRLRRALANAGEEGAACEIVLNEAQRAVPAESGAVLLADRGYLRFVAATGPRAATLIGLRLPRASGVAGYALQTQRPVLVGEARSHPRHYGALDDLTGYDTHQLLAVPISHAGAVLGVLELINPPPDRPFDHASLRCVEGLVSLLAARLAPHEG